MIEHQRYTSPGLSVFRLDNTPVYVLHKGVEPSPADKRFVAEALQKRLDRFDGVPLPAVAASISDGFVSSDFRNPVVTISHRETVISAYRRDGDGALKTWRYRNNDVVVLVVN